MFQARKFYSYVVQNSPCGLGLKIIGGLAEEPDDKDFGIFVKSVLPGGALESAGTIKEGDEIFAVNGVRLGPISNREAVLLLTEASNEEFSEFTVCRDDVARRQFHELLANYTYTNTYLNAYVNPNCLPEEPFRKVYSEGEHFSEALAMADGDFNHSSRAFKKHKTKTKASAHHDWSSPTSRQANVRQRDYQTTSPTRRGTSDLFDDKVRQTRKWEYEGQQDVSPSRVKAKSRPYRKVTAKSNARHVDTKERHLGRSPSADSASSGVSRTDSRRSSLSCKSSTGSTHSHTSQSVDHDLKIPVYRLESALRGMGMDLNPEKRSELHSKLRLDPDGCVTYGEFVKAAKLVFKRNKSTSTSHEIKSTAFEDSKILPTAASIPMFNLQVHQQMIQRLESEHQQLKQEVAQLKAALLQKDREIMKNQQASTTQSAILLQMSQSMEDDFNKVLQVLEAEIHHLRTNHPKADTGSQHRVAVLGCQLRKAEQYRRDAQAIIEKLMSLLQSISCVLGSDFGPELSNVDQQKIHLIKTTVDNTMKSVLLQVQIESLPFGWEEGCTAEGLKYFINHLEQKTTWKHPSKQSDCSEMCSKQGWPSPCGRQKYPSAGGAGVRPHCTSLGSMIVDQCRPTHWEHCSESQVQRP